MTERGLPIADGASACPFVAFDDDRDERAAVPDHRHRCYAETPPAPRAIAHQEAYCLSSAFPVCPTFQDWARREAARARGGGGSGSRQAPTAAEAGMAGAAAMAAGGGAAVVGRSEGRGAADPDEDASGDAIPVDRAGGRRPGDDEDSAGRAGDEADDGADEGDDDARSGPALPGTEPEAARRNPPRDWAAPPPWLASAEGSVGSADDAEPPPFLGRRGDPAAGLAGSAADRLAGGPPVGRRGREEERWSDGEPEEDRTGPALDAGAGAGAAAVAAATTGSRGGRERGVPAQPQLEAAWDEDAEAEAQPRRITRRPRAYDQHLGGPDGPDWERPRRYEAYPTIRTRVAMPHIPRLAAMAAVIAVLAIALFLLPGLLNLGGAGGGGQPAASSSTRPAASAASLPPTQPPAPTPLVYTLKKNDVLSKVAAKYGLTLDELLAANPTIKNPNKVAEGQQIIIPVPSSAPPGEVGGSSPSAGASAP